MERTAAAVAIPNSPARARAMFEPSRLSPEAHRAFVRQILFEIPHASLSDVAHAWEVMHGALPQGDARRHLSEAFDDVRLDSPQEDCRRPGGSLPPYAELLRAWGLTLVGCVLALVACFVLLLIFDLGLFAGGVAFASGCVLAVVVGIGGVIMAARKRGAEPRRAIGIAGRD